MTPPPESHAPDSTPSEERRRRRGDDTERPPDCDDRWLAAADSDDDRSRRARTEPMTVRRLRDDRYVVETEGGTYVVDLDETTCTCPDHAIRGARCKHLRRVAIEVTEGRMPAPGMRESACAVCGERLFVPRAAAGPHLCADDRVAPGDLVRDRETGKVLVVAGEPNGRADATETAEGRVVADYGTNAAYGGHEPVVPAVYLESVDRLGRDGLAGLPRYWFPASRLVALGRRYAFLVENRGEAAGASV